MLHFETRTPQTIQRRDEDDEKKIATSCIHKNTSIFYPIIHLSLSQHLFESCIFISTRLSFTTQTNKSSTWFWHDVFIFSLRTRKNGHTKMNDVTIKRRKMYKNFCYKITFVEFGKRKSDAQQKRRNKRKIHYGIFLPSEFAIKMCINLNEH